MGGGGESPVHEKDTDWMAFVLVVLVFAALLLAILVLGRGLEVPFLRRRL